MLGRCVLTVAAASSLGTFAGTSPLEASTDATDTALAVKHGPLESRRAS